MGKRIFIYVFWLLLFCMMSGQVIGQNKSVESHSHTCKTVLALKNNLLYDLALAPNIEVELPLGKRWSLNVEYKCPWWSDSGCNFCYQLLSGGTEARYWLGNRHTRGRLSGHFLGAYAEGGEVKVPPGKYAVVAYNFNTESIQIRGDESYETIEAFTGHCTGLDVHEDMVWSPDPLYVVALDEVEIRQSDVALPLDWKPEAVVDHYSFDIKVEGWDRISSIICHVDGLNGSYFIGNRACHLSEVPICVDTKRENGLLWGYFSSFVLLKDTKTRADSPMLLTLKIVKRDKTVQEVKVDITEVIETAPPSGGGEEEPDVGVPGSEIHIEVPVPEDKVVVDDLEPGTDEGDGGIGGDVDDWDDETDVELPVN